MKLWLNQGYLPDDLEVRAASEASFSQLRYRKHEIDPTFEQEFPPSQAQAQASSPSQPANAPPLQGQEGGGSSLPTVPDASVYPGMAGGQVWLFCLLLLLLLFIVVVVLFIIVVVVIVDCWLLLLGYLVVFW